MIALSTLRLEIATEKTKLQQLKRDVEMFNNLKCLSTEFREQIEKFYAKAIDDCELNICAAEDKYYDIVNDCQDMLAEMRGEEE